MNDIFILTNLCILMEEIDPLNPFNPPLNWTSMGVSLGERKQRKGRDFGIVSYEARLI